MLFLSCLDQRQVRGAWHTADATHRIPLYGTTSQLSPAIECRIIEVVLSPLLLFLFTRYIEGFSFTSLRNSDEAAWKFCKLVFSSLM